MANECSGEWKLRVTFTRKDGHVVQSPQAEPDGKLVINNEGSNGVLTGTHTNSPSGIKNGKCTHNNPGPKPHKISFEREHTPQPGIKFVYNGTVENDGLSMSGQFHIEAVANLVAKNTRPATEELALDPGDGGTWQGTKPPDPDDDDDNDDGDNGDKQARKDKKDGGQGYGTKGN
jgi:hypothetical protein